MALCNADYRRMIAIIRSWLNRSDTVEWKIQCIDIDRVKPLNDRCRRRASDVATISQQQASHSDRFLMVAVGIARGLLLLLLLLMAAAATPVTVD